MASLTGNQTLAGGLNTQAPEVPHLVIRPVVGSEPASLDASGIWDAGYAHALICSTITSTNSREINTGEDLKEMCYLSRYTISVLQSSILLLIYVFLFSYSCPFIPFPRKRLD